MITRKATEAECQSVLVEAAKRGGWLCHAERAAMRQSGKWSTPITGDAGFPDLVLSHPTRGTVYWELKRRPNKPTPAQTEWLELLGGELVWVPEETAARAEWLINGDEVCQNCGKWLITDPDGGPGYPTLTHRSDADRERCFGLANQVNA